MLVILSKEIGKYFTKLRQQFTNNFKPWVNKFAMFEFVITVYPKDKENSVSWLTLQISFLIQREDCVTSNCGTRDNT